MRGNIILKKKKSKYISFFILTTLIKFLHSFDNK